MPQNMTSKSKPQGPDPAVMEAIQRLIQTELSPLEEVIFQSWMNANQLEETPDMPFDYRGLYQETNGKVFAPGELKTKIEKQSAIQSLMQAQQAHDEQSPMKIMMDHMNGGSEMGSGLDLGSSQESSPDMGGDTMGSMMGSSAGPVDNLG